MAFRTLVIITAWLVCLEICSSFKNEVDDLRGYLLLSPNELTKKAMNSLYLSLYDVNASGRVRLALLKKENKTLLAEQTTDIRAGATDVMLELNVPDVDDYDAQLEVSGKFNTRDGYTIYGVDTVNLRDITTNLIFIQTDKPLYKPGQAVLFRVLALNSNLRPVTKNTQIQIRIEDPSNAVVNLWNNVTLQAGLVQLQLPLSDEPNLGVWNIYATIGSTEQVQQFKVSEYVLPKFEVTIKPPPYVLVDAIIIPIDICSNYTYGKDVEGTLLLNMSLETYSWSQEKIPTVIKNLNIKGCTTYNLNVSLVDNDYSQIYRRIKIYAEVKEKGTDVIRNATEYISRTQYPLSIRFVNDDGNNYFKPGLPTYIKVKVTHPDGTPAPRERISLCMDVSRERQIGDWWSTKKDKYCVNYTTDANGTISHIVPPQTTDTVKLDFEAKSLKYTGKEQPPYQTLYQPVANSNLRSWFSDSGNFMQLQPIEDPLPCGTKVNIEVLFTAESNMNRRFYYQVVSSGKIQKKKFVDVNFDIQDDVSSEYWDDFIQNAKRTRIIPDPKNEKIYASSNNRDCKVFEETEYVPYIGSAVFSIDVTSDIAPYFYLLVYYIRNEDRETIADSRKFTVQKCFPNKVTMNFADKTKQPGAKTSLAVSASPNSLCGISAIDKSISLLDSTESLTSDQVYDRLASLDPWSHYPRQHCQDGVQPGLQPRKSMVMLPFPPIPREYSTSSYEDALTAFEISGFLVISDLKLLMRPCHTETQHVYPFARGGAMYMALDSASAEAAPLMAKGPSSSVTKSVVDIRNYFPERWLFELHYVGANGKLQLQETLPHTVTQWVGKAVCIHKVDGLGISEPATIYGFQAFFLSLTLPYSVIRGETLAVTITAFNYIDKCLPITIELTKSADFNLISATTSLDVCVCGSSSKSVQFFIQPATLGVINITARGQSNRNSHICRSSVVSNAMAKDAISNTLLVESEGFPLENVNSYYFFPKDTQSGTFEQDIQFVLPKGAIADSARGFMSVSGDIMGPVINNLNNLLQMPTGCGEQAIVAFAPNIYVMDYLTAVGQLTDKIRQTAIKNLLAGLQRELKYRRSDYSYSTFGEADTESSMFLTAYVCRVYSQARRYIYISDSDIQKSCNWVVSKQLKDGSFPNLGQTFTEALKGGAQGNSTSSMTAFVLLSLLLAQQSPANATKKAMSVILSETNPTPYQASLFAYTAAEAGYYSDAEYFLNELYRTADTTGGRTSWSFGSQSVSIEMGANAILAILKLGKQDARQQAAPIVKWLTSNLTSSGGFSSSYDTVLGIMSLSKFAAVAAGDPVNIVVELKGGLNEEITIMESDRMVVQTRKVSVPSKVLVLATGSGGGLIQAILRCNTIQPNQGKYFLLKVRILRKSSKMFTINICTKYLIQGKESNMALIDVKMLSDMVPNKESLNQMQGNTNSGLGVQRVDVEANHVIVYFDKLTNQDTCFSFDVDQVAVVKDLKPATVKVVDYYATERVQESFYLLNDGNTGVSNGAPPQVSNPSGVRPRSTLVPRGP